MISQVTKKGTIRFVYSPDAPVKTVCLAGSFNKWQPASMKKQKNGVYTLEVKMTKGKHEYKFIVDDVWQLDPANTDTVQNTLGTNNSVLVVN